MCKITVAGDMAPLSKNQNIFEIGERSSIMNDVEYYADCFVANLECPLTNSKIPITKSGPNIKASLKTIKGIKNIGVDVVNLANNHILDFGKKGYNDTIKELEKNHINYFGSGNTLIEANNIFIREIAGLKIGFYGVTEFEWSIATESEPGANPIDKIRFLEAKKDIDIDHFIVFIHGGKEHFNLPTPNLQKLARFYADYGASIVICQHTHIIGCHETYNNVPIFYGQGNFIFNNPDRIDPNWNSGFLINLNFSKKSLKWNLTFFNQSKDGGVKRMDIQDEEEHINLFKERSTLILNKEKFHDKWVAECIKDGWKFERELSGINKRIYHVLRKMNFPKIFFQKSKTTIQIGILRCETHREVLKTFLVNKMN